MENHKLFFESVDKMFSEILSESSSSLSGSYNFEKDIVVGENGEDFVKLFLESKGFKFIKSNKDVRYDLLMSYKEKEYMFEIKTDMFNNTGNIAIEFESWGKKSGIDATESDFFVTYFVKLKEIWIIETWKLRNLIKENNFKIKEGAGDKGSNTKLYLIPKEQQKDNFKIHKIS